MSTSDDELRAMPAVQHLGEQFRERELQEIRERREEERRTRRGRRNSRTPPSDRDLRGLATLRRLGAQFRALERQEEYERRRRLGWVRAGLLAVPTLAIAAAVALVLSLAGGPASATSLVNRAPAAAMRAGSVRFHSTITVGLAGRTLQRFTQTGEVDFVHGVYRTALGIDGAAATQEWRTANGVLYLAVTEHGPNARRRVRWIGVRLSTGERARIAAVPERGALTDPLALLNLLAGLDAPTKKLGSTTINGSQMTEYQLTSNLAAALRASQPGATVPASARHVEATISVWLERRGRPTRIEERLGQLGPHGRANLRQVLDFVGYGSRVAIQVPTGVQPSPKLRGTVTPPFVGTPSRLFESLIRPQR